MPFAAALSTAAQTAAALDQVCNESRSHFSGQPDLAVAFFSTHHAEAVQALNAAAQGHADPTLVNLASQEYFGAVDARALTIPVVNIRFLEERDGEARIISFFAKKARGLMARWAINALVR